MINETFKNNLNSIGVELTDRQYEQFDMYYKLLVEWNSFMNLTGITDYEEVLLKHYVDSLVLDIEKIGHKKKEISLIDVGTGAGFPGLPLKIAHPQINVVLLDSLNKRVKFLNQVIEELGLTGIETVHSRAEDGGRNNDLREHFDVSVSRAVANLATLVEYNLPFVKVGGYFVAYKSGDIDEELLDMLFEMIDEAKNAPLSSDKCVIERDRALDLIDDVRSQFPIELSEARKMMARRAELEAAAVGKQEGGTA